jgi:two-component system CheB/CheR fusion protein
VFTDHDLLGDPPFSRIDLVSCRNLAIYLQPEEQRKVPSMVSLRCAMPAICFSAPPRRSAN